jgi:hypothetical protein
LSVHKAETKFGSPEDFVFPTDRGGKANPSNVRSRIMARTVERANENLTGHGAAPLPEAEAKAIGPRSALVFWAAGNRATAFSPRLPTNNAIFGPPGPCASLGSTASFAAVEGGYSGKWVSK